MKTNRGGMLAGLITIIMMLLIPGTSFSGIAELAPITDGLRYPGDVAVSSDGKVYVADDYKNAIFIYDRKGQPAGSISIKNPSSVAVSSNGYIYIGTKEDLSVKILDSSNKIIGSLGKGAGEFKLPRNITINESTGNVYVVDQLDHSIKVYTSDGAYISKINDYPNQPQDATIMNNEIYVIDQPLITDPSGRSGDIMRGAEIQVFDMAGNPIRNFGSYGAEEGQLKGPAGITSDAEGILYITDKFHGVVLCFDANGTYLGAIQNPLNPMLTPMGIALGKDRKLFVASLYTSNVRVFGLEGYTDMSVSPSALSFTAQENKSNPSDQSLTVTNSGTGELAYTASAESWIVLSKPSGTVGSNSSGAMPVGINITGLDAGIYSGSITITGNPGTREVIPVTLEVKASPVLSVTPQSLTYTYRIGDPEPSSQTATIGLSNDNGTTTWTATPGAAWINISPSESNSSTVASVDVDPSNLNPGVYTGNITINAQGAVGSPANIEVKLTVIASGTINVSCNIPEASFTIASPNNYEGSGLSWTATGVPDGTYTITYNSVKGYKTPQPETKTISGGSAISFDGNYISLAMSANIVVSRGADFQNPPTIGIFDGNGTMFISFTPFSGKKYTRSTDKIRYGVSGPNTAVGDIDGDGKADILAGLASGSSNPARVAAYRSDGTLIEGSDFIALSTMYGANVAAADFDGDGKAEIVAGAGADSENPAQVRVFSYYSGTITDTGIDFNAFDVKGGVNVAAGDVDGDGVPELVTAAGASNSAMPEVRVWKVNISAVPWSIIDTGIHFVAFSGRYGASVTTGDLNGDGISEIIVGSGPNPKGGTNKIKVFKVFNGDGTEFGLEITDSSVGYGLNVASGDINNDGKAEIVAGLGPSSKNPSTVKMYSAYGVPLGEFTAFDGAIYGAVVSVGDLGYGQGGRL